MKKKPEREFVTVRPEVRNGITTFVLTWYPTKGTRRRMRFHDAGKAERKADEMEAWMQRSQESMTPEILKDVQTALILRDQLALGVTLSTIVQEYAKHGHTVAASSILVKTAGEAF